VLGCVVGAFGECSEGIYFIRDLVARALSLRLTDHIAIPDKVARAIYRDKLTRHWGLTFARGWARLLLNRRTLVVSEAARHYPPSNSSSTGQGVHGAGRSTVDRDDDAYAHHLHRQHHNGPDLAQ
jgi:hypothetical protein